MRTRLFLFQSLAIFSFLIACGPGTEKGAEEKSQAKLELPLELKLVRSEAWSERDSGFILTKGAEGLLEAPAWWTGNRPPAGEMVVLEVAYRDDLTQPVRAEVYSGMGSSSSYSELHRFGGLDDSAWKTARIPCPWDLTLLHFPSSTVRFRLISDSGDLELKSFRLVEPEADDEQRYNTQTREWVRQLQSARVRVEPEYYKLAQTPVLDNQWADSPLVPYQRNWTDLVLTISAPQAGETGFPVSVRMARNEYEPVQIGIYANGTDLSEVEVTVDPITGPNGAAVAASRVRVAEYSLIDSRISALKVEPFPQRLWPAHSFAVPAGRSHLVWIELHTAEKTAIPGKYSTSIRIRAKDLEEITVPLSLEILPYRLLTMDEANLKLGGCILGFVPEHDLAFQREYNHNMADPHILPELFKEGDSFGMDFRIMDECMAAALRQGFKTIYLFLGGNPNGFPQTMTLERNLAKVVFGLDDKGWRAMVMEKPDSVHPRLAPYLVEWTRRLGEHAKAQSWPSLILSPFDEPNKWAGTSTELGSLAFIKSHFIHTVQLLREGWPDVLIGTDMYTYTDAIVFLPYLDIYNTNSTHLNLNLPNEVRTAGKTFWEYTTVDVTPAFSRYTLGFYFGAHGSTGALLWAYNWGKRFDTLDDPNWLYAWYTPFEVIPTVCMEGVREGMDERRLLETLKRKAAEKNVDLSGFLGDLFQETEALREDLRFFVISTWPHARSGKTFTIEDLRKYEKRAGVMNTWHDRLVDKLLSLQ
ncbi:MAG TPA: hypothetical protein VM123_03880 [archaeon]|nr:hypothetical protein [archaeon]